MPIETRKTLNSGLQLTKKFNNCVTDTQFLVNEVAEQENASSKAYRNHGSAHKYSKEEDVPLARTLQYNVEMSAQSCPVTPVGPSAILT